MLLEQENDTLIDEPPQTVSSTRNQLIESAGGFGRYQLLITAVMVLGYVNFGAIIYGLFFFELLPEYTCGQDFLTPCSAEDICKEHLAYQVDWGSQTSLHNWVDQLNLICRSPTEIAMLGSAFLIGQALGLILFPVVVLKVGMRKPWLLSVYAQTVINIALLVSNRYDFSVTLMALLGLSSGRISFSYVYMTDLVPKSHLSLVSTLYQGLDGLTILIQSLYFRYISHYYQIYLTVISIITAIVALLATIYLVESPIFLLQNDKMRLAHNSLTRIAKINKTTTSFNLDPLQILKTEEGDDVQQMTFKEQVLQGRLRNVLCIATCWIITSVNYFLLEFELPFLKGGLYWNAGVSSLAEFLGCLAGGLMLAKSADSVEKRQVRKLKWSLFTVYATCLVGAAMILIAERYFPSWTPLFVLLVNLGIGSSYVVQSGATIWLFPSSMHVKLFSILNFCAILTSAISPFAAEIQQPIPVILLMIFSVLGSISSLIINQTQF